MNAVKETKLRKRVSKYTYRLLIDFTNFSCKNIPNLLQPKSPRQKFNTLVIFFEYSNYKTLIKAFKNSLIKKKNNFYLNVIRF